MLLHILAISIAAFPIPSYSPLLPHLLLAIAIAAFPIPVATFPCGWRSRTASRGTKGPRDGGAKAARGAARRSGGAVFALASAASASALSPRAR